jgi:predicted permease
MLDPVASLFLCIAAGFVLRVTNILPQSSGKVMAKLITWVFYPALCFTTMAKYCTVETLSTHAANLTLSVCGVALAMAIAIPLSHVFVREGGPERGIYAYALAFANSAYMGDPLVLTLFGDEMLSYYKMYCLPITITIYIWGISVLVPKKEGKQNPFKKLLNPPMVAMLLGIVAGLTGLGGYMPEFLSATLNSLKSCMGPVAMLLVGFTVASYPMREMLNKKGVYVASILRLTAIPAVLIAALFALKTLANLAFGLAIDNTVLFLCFFAVATPLGLNTVVFPESFGGNPKTGASMALISHTIGVLSLPLLFALMTFLFGKVA